MVLRTTVAGEFRSRIIRWLAILAVALSLGTGLSFALAPEPAEARVSEEIMEPEECNAFGFMTVAGVVVQCR